nr:uncharacterized protein LOC109169324 [Ipomoea batatas]
MILWKLTWETPMRKGHMEENTSGGDKFSLEANDLLTPTTNVLKAFSLGDHLASQKKITLPKVELKTFTFGVEETLEGSNWISNDPLEVDMGDTNEEGHMEENTSGGDKSLEANDLLTPPPMYKAFSLGDHLASQKENNTPKEPKHEAKRRTITTGTRVSSRSTIPNLQYPPSTRKIHTWISTREFKKERGILLNVPAKWNWGPTFTAQPGDAFSGLAREFYANVGDGIQTDNAIVRGVEVSFSVEDINAYYGLENHETHDYYHRELRLNRLPADMLGEIARSFHPGAIWNIRQGLPAHIDYHYFGLRDRALLDFIKAKLIPFSHRGNV